MSKMKIYIFLGDCFKNGAFLLCIAVDYKFNISFYLKRIIFNFWAGNFLEKFGNFGNFWPFKWL